MSTSLDIIIVNWNSKKQLINCLQSIVDTQKQNFELRQVLIIDNASSDNSLDALDQVPLPITVIRNPVNRGFAAACNQGGYKSNADYLLFLNPDTVLFQNSLSGPIAFLEQPEAQTIGITGIQLVDDDGKVTRTCAQFPIVYHFYMKMLGLDRIFPRYIRSYPLDTWNHQQSRTVDHVIGAFFLVRRKVFDALAGFDEHFFVYLEDLDFSLRSYKAGWLSYYLTEYQAFHKGGGTSEQVKATRLFYSLRSRIIYAYKHFDQLSATGIALGTLLIEPLVRLIYAGLRLSISDMSETIKAYAKLWQNIPQLIRGRN